MLKKDVASLEGSVKNKDRTIAELEAPIRGLIRVRVTKLAYDGGGGGVG